MCKSLLFLERLAALHAEPPPIPKDLHPAAYELAQRGYDDHAIRRAVGMLSMLGTAECNEFIDVEDRDAIEELLPLAPAAAWEAHSAWVWTTEGHAIADLPSTKGGA